MTRAGELPRSNAHPSAVKREENTQHMFTFGQSLHRTRRKTAPSGESGEECGHPHMQQAQHYCSLSYRVDLIVSKWQIGKRLWSANFSHCRGEGGGGARKRERRRQETNSRTEGPLDRICLNIVQTWQTGQLSS